MPQSEKVEGPALDSKTEAGTSLGHSPDECPLQAEIVILETRTKFAFADRDPARKQVSLLLDCARSHDLSCGRRLFLERAQHVFCDRLLSRNRTRYLLGVAIGILINIALAQFARLLSLHSLNELGMETPACCVWMLLFAGMGTLCSVFGRLGGIDMCDEPVAVIIWSSGFFRPVLASFFAFAIVQMLKVGMVHVGSATSASEVSDDTHHLYLIAAFLAGFSERFGPDLMGRAERTFGAPSPPAPTLGTVQGGTAPGAA